MDNNSKILVLNSIIGTLDYSLLKIYTKFLTVFFVINLLAYL